MSRSYLHVACVVALSGALQAQLQFTDVTAPAGVTSSTTFSNNFTGGGGCGDFDRDGDQDLFFVMGRTAADRLFLNDGTGVFTDVASAWGVAATHMGTAMAVGDYDDDGWLDIYLLSLGTGPGASPGKHRLYHNLGGTGFAQVATAAGVAFTAQFVGDGYGTCFGDYDMDGDLDLVATGWATISAGNRIFRNNGNGTFTNVTTAATGTALNGVRGYTPQLFDMDGDLDPELLYASDFHTSRYLVNNGDGTFTDATATSGTALDSNGMGSVVADFNGDLLPDWYVTSIWEDGGCSSGNMLYLNQGADQFAETSIAAGVNDGGWGWGTVSADLDLDGDVDLVENNGWLGILTDHAEPDCVHDQVPQWIGEPAYLWLNDGDGSHFTEQHAAAGLDFAFDGRGLLNVDIDGDGDQDIALFAHAGPVKLFRNDGAVPGRHWLRVFLDNQHAPGVPPDGLGAKVYATSGSATRMAPVLDKPSFISACELSAHFGLGSATQVDELRVEWPDGTRTWLDALVADQTLTVTHHGWKLLGGGLAGTGGVQPQFSGQGDLTGGEIITLQMTSAAPSAATVLFIGLFQLDAPFKGGVLVPAPDVVVPGFFTDPSGSLVLAAPWPTGLPSQLVLSMQVWVADGGAIHGASGTNALQITTP